MFAHTFDSQAFLVFSIYPKNSGKLSFKFATIVGCWYTQIFSVNYAEKRESPSICIDVLIRKSDVQKHHQHQSILS